MINKLINIAQTINQKISTLGNANFLFTYFLANVICYFSRIIDETVAYFFLSNLLISGIAFYVLFFLETIDKTNIKFSEFAFCFTTIFLRVLIMFTISNLALYYIDSSNFKNISDTSFLSIIFYFFHYTFMCVTSAGFFEIYANSKISNFYAMIQVFTGMFFLYIF